MQKAAAGLAEAELDLERSQVKAPYAGRVASVEAAEGNQVSINQQLLSLYDPATLELRARIPMPFLNELEQSRNSGYPLTGTAEGYPAGLQLRLVRLAGEADPSGIDALFAIGQEGDRLRLGQMLKFTLRRAIQQAVLAVPYSVLYGNDRAYKLVDGRLQGLRLENLGSFVATDGSERLLIRSTQLQAGDALVITHLPNAVEGLRVEAVNTP